MHIQFPGLDPIPILFEDRTVLAMDKPAGWMLIPFTWQRTNRNLQAAIESSIAAGHFWARSRNVRYLRHVHRLDAETTGILLFAKSAGALEGVGRLFEQRKVEKTYLAVVGGVPEQESWNCRLPLGPDPVRHGRMRIDAQSGKPAETSFRVLNTVANRTLLECRPVTGRTHQIRIHLQSAGLTILGDPLYGPGPGEGLGGRFPMGLRAVKLAFRNPFTRKDVVIRAARRDFLAAFEFPLPTGHEP